ncbi:MAG: hypothetical protein J5736_03290 [Bacilli bacterium]|nr:hypothetical protein [Bacilli bacterium]
MPNNSNGTETPDIAIAAMADIETTKKRLFFIISLSFFLESTAWEVMAHSGDAALLLS